MDIFGKWIMQIIVIMLIGTIVELMLPHHHMKKYVNLVMGLLLLLVLSQPILHVFSVDVTSMVSQIENSIFQDNATLTNTEKSVQFQKDEIQATQDAYIWNEISSQLKQAANDSVEEEFSLQIKEIMITPSEKKDELEAITVLLGEIENENKAYIQPISPIRIQVDDGEGEGQESDELKQIQQHLATIWDVQASQIHIQWEGQID